MKNIPEVVIIHHTAVGGASPQFWAVNNYHKSKSFPRSSFGYYVGYHYFIEKSGKVSQARAHTDIGAHTLEGWNKRSIGVCLAGDFNYEQPTSAQLQSLKELVARLSLPVDLHRNKQEGRTCPGKNFTLELLEDPSDFVDEEKARLIKYYMQKYPQLRVWLLDLLSKLRK